jgi:hypothetical protein
MLFRIVRILDIFWCSILFLPSAIIARAYLAYTWYMVQTTCDSTVQNKETSYPSPTPPDSNEFRHSRGGKNDSNHRRRWGASSPSSESSESVFAMSQVNTSSQTQESVFLAFILTMIRIIRHLGRIIVLNGTLVWKVNVHFT